MKGSLKIVLLAFSLIIASAVPFVFEFGGPVGEASGLVVTTTLTLTADKTYNEDIYIRSGGHLTIGPGVVVRMGSGYKIYVEDGQLSVIGGVNRMTRIWGNGVFWGGIEADEDAKIVMYNCEIKWAEIGLHVIGSGHSGTTGSVMVNSTHFLVCDKGIVLNGGGKTAPFKCRIWNSYITNVDRGIEVANGYDDFTVEDMSIYDVDENGVYISNVKGNIIRNLTINEAVYGITFGMLNGPITIDNNTIRGCKIGMNGAFFSSVVITNNSIFASEKGIWVGFTHSNLIENNIITVISDVNRAPIEMESSTPASIIRNNILSGCGALMIINGSDTGVNIYDNLLTNLTDPMYIDTNGDGYCDVDVRADGVANAWAKKCRTSVVPKNMVPGSATYVNPAQAASNAASGSRLVMLSDPAGYGPKNLENRQIYHSKLPYFDSSVHLEGQEKENIVFYPAACTQDAEFNTASNAGLSNISVKEGAVTVKIVDSDNITIKDIESFGYNTRFGLKGIDIDGSSDVYISDIYLSSSYLYGFNITGSQRITIKDSRVSSPEGKGVYMELSHEINADNVSVSAADEPALYSLSSSFSWNGSELRSKQESIVMYDSHNCVLSFIEPRTYVPSDRLMVVNDCIGTRILDSDFQMGFRSYDFYGLEFYGDTQDTLIERCNFIAESGHSHDTYGMTSHGNFSGSTVKDCHFVQMTYGVGIIEFTGVSVITNVEISETSFSHSEFGSIMMAQGNISILDSSFVKVDYGHYSLGNDLFILDGYFNDFNYGLGATGNIEIINCTLIDGNYGITLEGSSGEEELIIDGLQSNNILEGIHIETSTMSINDASFNNNDLCVNATDTDISSIKDSDFQNGVPIKLGLDSDTQNRVELRNCTGDHTLTDATSTGCYANWTWPLTVYIDDEAGDPLTCALEIDSDLLGSIFIGLVDGYAYFPGLLGYSINDIGITDTKDYDVSVEDLEDSDSYPVEMTQERTLNFVLNHAPTVSGSAPSEITINEDEGSTLDISDWFKDRDELTYSLSSSSPSEVAFNMDGILLDIEPQANWSGDGEFEIKAVDTFAEEISHTVILHVLPVNDPPFLTGDIPVINITEDGTAWINLSKYVHDIDSSILDHSFTAVENISITWNGPNLTLEPAEDWFGIKTISIMVHDESETLEFNITVNVTPVNDPPSWLGDPVIPITVNAGEDYQMDILDRVLDVDDDLEDLLITFDPQNGSISGSLVTISYPQETKNMSELITVTISDGEFSTSFQFDVTVVEKVDIPVEPELDIDEVDISVDEENGDWTVDVQADEGQDIWIVVDGVGSFKLEETSPGHYKVVIPGDNFEEGDTYDYHFSNEEDGPDGTNGSHIGSLSQPEITPPGDDDDDDIGGGGSNLWWLWILLVVVLVIGILAFLLLRKGGSDDYYEE